MERPEIIAYCSAQAIMLKNMASPDAICVKILKMGIQKKRKNWSDKKGKINLKGNKNVKR
jgi:hypothetical protein